MRSTLHSRLIRFAAFFALLATALSFSGGLSLAGRPVPGASASPRLPLLLAIACGLAAWAVSLATADRAPAQGRRWTRFGLYAALLVVGLNVLMLAQAPLPTDYFTCLSEKPIGKGFRHFFNCDSPEFLDLARSPRLIVDHPIRQSRPLSFAAAYVIARPLHLVPRLEKFGPYRPFAPEFVAYIVINLGLLVATLLLFTRLLESTAGVRAGAELLFATVVLAVNDVTKMFFWTPHTQIYNLFVGCLTFYVAVRLIARGQALAIREAMWLGLGMAAGLLIYGSFAIPILCIALIELVMYRRVLPVAVFGAAAVVPYVCWILLLVWRTGQYYNHEVAAFRQFVWMIDCAKLGPDACLPVVSANLTSFFNVAAAVLTVPLTIFLACRVASAIRQPAPVVPAAQVRTIGIALAFVLPVTATFLLLMGFYSGRLIWLLVPPVLFAIALELLPLRLATPRSRRWLFDAGTLLASLIYIVVLNAHAGPFK